MMQRVEVSSPRPNRWAPFALSLSVVAPFCFARVQESDLGWHLAVGRLMAQRGPLTRNGLSWTFPDYPAHSTSWLFDQLSYAAYRAGGLAGVQLLTLVLVSATLWAVTDACARAHPGGGAWLAPVVAALLLPRLTPRAFLCSWLLLAACVALCTAARRGEWRLRLLCVPLIAAGSNLHSGAVFAAVALAVACLEAGLLEKRWWREGLIAAGGGAALLANPAGASNVLYAVHHLWMYQALPISELQTPGLLDLPAFYLSMVLALALAYPRRREAPGDLVLVLAFAACGIWVARVAFDFYLVAAPVMAAGIRRLEAARGRRARFLLFTLLTITCVGTNAHRALHLKLGAAWDAAALPVRAAEFIRARGLKGRLFNSFGDGGYLAFALPGLPVFQDGRTQAYPRGFFAELSSADRSPEAFDRFLRQRGVEWAVVETQGRALAGSRLDEVQGWALVYWDEHNEILVRRDVAALEPLIASDEFQLFHPLRVDPGSLEEEITRLPPSQAERYLAEVVRFQKSSPEDRFAARARCALEKRLATPGGGTDCAKADALERAAPVW